MFENDINQRDNKLKSGLDLNAMVYLLLKGALAATLTKFIIKNRTKGCGVCQMSVSEEAHICSRTKLLREECVKPEKELKQRNTAEVVLRKHSQASSKQVLSVFLKKNIVRTKTYVIALGCVRISSRMRCRSSNSGLVWPVTLANNFFKICETKLDFFSGQMNGNESYDRNPLGRRTYQHTGVVHECTVLTASFAVIVQGGNKD